MRSITLLVRLVQPWGDHFEGHFEGQNGVSECQPESGCSRELVFAQLAQRMVSAADMPVVHGMQEVSGSSPLSSTWSDI
jgi:hypothetical protein